jgi:hypothetical protein
MGPVSKPKPTPLIKMTRSVATMWVTGLLFRPEKPADTQSEILGDAIVDALRKVDEN